MNTLIHLFIDIVNQQESIYYVPGTVLGTGGSNGTKMDVGFILIELTVQQADMH